MTLFRRCCVFLFASILIVCVSAEDPPAIPVWPLLWEGNWSFVNSTTGEVLQGGGWYFDATSRPALLRQDNRVNCQGPNDCAAIFRDGKLYKWTSSSTCCIQNPDLPPTPPDWLSTSVTYQGEGAFKYAAGIRCSVWKREETGETYYQSIEGALPIALDGSGTAMVWSNFNPRKPDAGVFSLPTKCASSCNIGS